MADSHRNTAFYVEALILTCVFAVVLLIDLRVFSAAHRVSADAASLSDAVSLAKNAAEAVSASGSEADLYNLLNENGSAERQDGAVSAWYGKDLLPGRDNAAYRVSVTWDESGTGSGALVKSRISVFAADGETALYSLDTSVYLPAGKGGAT